MKPVSYTHLRIRIKSSGGSEELELYFFHISGISDHHIAILQMGSIHGYQLIPVGDFSGRVRNKDYRSAVPAPAASLVFRTGICFLLDRRSIWLFIGTTAAQKQYGTGNQTKKKNESFMIHINSPHGKSDDFLDIDVYKRQDLLCGFLRRSERLHGIE